MRRFRRADIRDGRSVNGYRGAIPQSEWRPVFFARPLTFYSHTRERVNPLNGLRGESNRKFSARRNMKVLTEHTVIERGGGER